MAAFNLNNLHKAFLNDLSTINTINYNPSDNMVISKIYADYDGYIRMILEQSHQNVSPLIKWSQLIHVQGVVKFRYYSTN